MGTTKIRDGETKELISADDMVPEYRFSVADGDVQLAHSHGGAQTGNLYPEGYHATLGNLEGTAVFGFAPNGDALVELDDASFSLFDVTRTTFTGSAIALEVGTSQVDDQNPLPVDDSALHNPTGLAFGQHSTASSGTAEALNGGASQPVPDGGAVAVKALDGNSGAVYIGDGGVGTGTGFEMQPGEGVSLSVTDVSNVFVDVSTGGDGVSWIVEVS